MKRHTNENTNSSSVKQSRILLLIVAVITAIAVAVTCALCFDKMSGSVAVDNVSGGEVNTSANKALTTAGTYDYSTSGALSNNDTISMAYCNGYYTVKLPQGTYKLEVWGGQGGGPSATAYGGYGGYTYGQISFTATTTVYVYPGGGGGYQSTATTAAFNGGGRLTTAHPGGGGGGASHIATASGTLSALGAGNNNILVVAGGGGGTGCSCAYTTAKPGSGGGGNAAGTDAPSDHHSSNRGGGYGGKTNAVGAAGVGNGGSAGAFGKGGDQTSEGSGTGGGAGGGGYYGGGSGGADYPSHNDNDDGPGGGGSGYVNTSRITSGTYGGTTGANGAASATATAGRAVITAINVNSNPTSRNATVTGRARGTSGNTTFYASTIAQDSDSGQTVHFTDGTSGAYDTFNTNPNTGLYLNSACTVLATEYISWTWSSNTQCNITEFKKYPRNGTYSTLDGRLTLYTKIRDSFGTTVNRGYNGSVMFYLSFAKNTTTNQSGSKSTTVNGVASNYILGNSTTNATPASNYVPSTSNIYNPLGTGRFTAIVSDPVKINNSFTIKASDLIGSVCTYDQVLIALSDTSKIISSNGSRKFKVNELDSGSGKVTAYTSGKGAIANAFSSITVTCLSPDPAYQTLTVTLYVVEKSTAWGTSYPNSVVPGVGTVTLDIVFKMQNSRPYISGTSNIVDVAVGETRTLSLSGYFADADGAISSSTHSIVGAVVPANEFIQLDASRNILAQSGSNAGFYNIGALNGDVTFNETAQGTTATGFNSGIAYNSTSAVAGTNTREAFMRFSYSGDTITVYGLRSSFSQYASGRASKPGHFYILLHIQDKRDVADVGIWLPLAFRIGYNSAQAEASYTPVSTITSPGSLTEQSAASVLPTASGSVGQSFYFAPMAVGYGGMHVIGRYMDADGNLSNDGLQPLALDGDNWSTTDGLAARSGKLNEFLRLSSDVTAESIVRSMSDVDVTLANGVAENRFIKSEIIKIYVDKSYFAAGTYQGAAGGRVIADTGTAGTDGYRYTGTLASETVNGRDYYVINGVKITLKAATMNRYFYSSVTVTDTSGKKSAAIDIAVRVNNTAPKAETNANNVVTFGSPDATDAYSLYENTSIPTFTLKIPLGNSIAITPYDFVNDFNMTNVGFTKPTSGFTLNGLQGVYDPATGTLSTSAQKTDDNISFNGLFPSEFNTDVYRAALAATLNTAAGSTTVKKVSAAASGTAAGSATETNKAVPNDRLYFARANEGTTDAFTYTPSSFADISVSAYDTTGFVSYNLGSTVQIGQTSYACDFIMINTLSRTTRDASIDLIVRDRYGDSADGTASFAVRIIIDVVNTAPSVKDEFRYQELAVTPVNDNGFTALSSVVFGSNGNGAATGLMQDIDGDMPEFMISAGVIITNTKGLAALLGRHPSEFNDAVLGNAAFFTDDGTADGRPLTDYITATLASSYELYVTARNSTKAIEGGVYVCFIVTDNNGGRTFGYVQIEVLDTAPVFNTSPDTGFDKNDPLWAVKTTSTADISRDRYIVGSVESSNNLKQYNGATDADIRIIATDADELHGNLVLSPRINRENGFDYINLVVPSDTSAIIPDEAFERAVPNVGIGTTFTDSTNAAVLLFTRTQVNGNVSDIGTVPSGFTAEILFFKDNRWIRRSEFIQTYLSGNSISELGEFFDRSGRFVFTDWAFRMHATQSFDNGARVGITVSVRDNAEFGGDSAGRTTAYATDRRNGKIDVSAAIAPTVFHSISTTGIRTKDEFARTYNDYYAVEYAQVGQAIRSYVPTYDGDTDSPYGADITDIKYNVIASNNWLSFDDTGENVLKSRTPNAPDGTKAGVNAGVLFDANTVASVEGAYKYPSVITVPADESSIYVPMSYFGLLQNLVTGADDNGDFEYHGEYVGYNINSTAVYSRATITDIASAISISDGNTIWTGLTLNDNPYVRITAFDEYSANGSTSSVAHFTNTNSTPYYNNRLAIRTVDAEGMLLGYEKNEANRASFIGNGTLMYLEDQAVKLQEHNFGLVFKKTNMRTGAQNITLTVNLAKSENGRNTIEDEDADVQTVTVSIRVENNKIDIAPDSGKGDTTGVKYDANKGTYYMDITMSSADSQSFTLLRRDPATGKVEAASDENADAKIIPYYDDDYGNNGSYRDRAYFFADSFNKLSAWDSGSAAYNRMLDVTSGSLTNTAAGASAQSSMLNYWRAANAGELADIDSDFIPNNGIYGSSTDGYSSYFNASLTDANRLLNVTANRKTTINEVAIPNLLNGKAVTQENVKALYAERGLVAEYADSSVNPITPTRTYYPFKVVVYDSCGVGWSDASFVSFELRITITNSDPKLKNVGTAVLDDNDNEVGREYRFNLAVGNSVTINLYELVSDSDMLVRQTGNNYALATRTYFEENATGIDIETGDYLDSPYAHDEYLSGALVYDPTNAVRKADGTYYRNGGGLSLMPTSDTVEEKDVTMWMETSPGISQANTNVVPRTNNLSFSVNRRTSATVKENGRNKNVSIDEYRFTLRFYDSFSRYTDKFTFIITITNQAPIITATERHFTMHSGDDLTLLTSYYDEFIGGVPGGSQAYLNSQTKTFYDAHVGQLGYGVTYGDGQNNATDDFWLFNQITSDRKDSVKYDSTVDRDDNDSKQHLGYLGLASDDTPWKLRISNIEYYNGQGAKIWVDRALLQLSTEGEGGRNYPLALNIRAISACVDEPVTVTIIDGDGGIVTTTVYITIISTPPVARDYTDPSDSVIIGNAGLEGETDDSGVNYKSGTFRLFTTPSGTATYEIDGFDTPKTARREYRIGMSSVAKDPDSADETDNMTLYGDGNFTVNGVPLVSDGNGIFHAEYFDISVVDNGRSFVLTATGFNPTSTSGYEELSFRIADRGNSSYENSIEITLNVYTMYSDMQNPTAAAKSSADFNTYLGGSEKITVKSYDEYYGMDLSVPSRYAYLALVGNEGNDGNKLSPIVDPDVRKVGQQTYTARMYAFIDKTDDGEWTALDKNTLSEMFVRDAASGTFMLRQSDENNKYFIGGRTYDGIEMPASGSATDRANAIKRYVDFEFAADGSAVAFMPNASTLDNHGILLYVEIQKNVGASRQYKRDDATLSAGTLFALEVEDSAPNVVTDVNMPEGVNWVASGNKGDTVSFTVFDSNNPFGALFTDSDYGDVVTVKQPQDADYAEILAKALEADPDLDWKASPGIPRAFDIIVDNASSTLTIKINRRMDSFNGGVYASRVSFPIELEGSDIVGNSVKTVIMVTIGNDGVGVAPSVEAKYDADGVGYTFVRNDDLDADDPETIYNKYTINAQIKYSHDLTIDLSDFMTDPDYTVSGDVDSYRFADSTKDRHPYSYLGDTVQTVYWYQTYPDGSVNPDINRELATVEAVGSDKWHRTGIKISAVGTMRTLTATTYLRILDRATDGSDVTAGVYITLNISVMNDAPYIKSGNEITNITLIGSDDGTPESMLFFIGDFVDDNNKIIDAATGKVTGGDVTGDTLSAASSTYLRIFSQQHGDVNSIYSTKYETVDGGGSGEDVKSSSLFTLTIPSILPDDLLNKRAADRAELGLDRDKDDNSNLFNQWFVITPIAGYYGDGSIEITVVDGDSSVQSDTMSTTFRINVRVLYDQKAIEDSRVAFNPVSIASCKSRSVDIGSLMPDLDNKLELGGNAQAVAAARAGSGFSQAEFYTLSAVELQDSSDASYVTFERVGNSGVWTLTATKLVTLEPIRINVKYTLNADPTREYSGFFMLSVVENLSPVMKFDSIDFVRYDKTGDLLRDLDETNTVRIEAWQLFTDPDDPSGTAMRFVGASSSVSSIVSVSLSEDNRFLIINFAAKGKSEITVLVADETGNPVELKFTAVNEDLPEGSLWLRIAAEFEANTLMWSLIVVGVLILLILLIIIIAVARRKKREREELEALLVSEMEIEEQMLKLAGGAPSSGYESFGYLPPTTQINNPDPNMMLGAGGGVARNNDLPELAAPPSDPNNTPPADDSGL